MFIIDFDFANIINSIYVMFNCCAGSISWLDAMRVRSLRCEELCCDAFLAIRCFPRHLYWGAPFSPVPEHQWNSSYSVKRVQGCEKRMPITELLWTTKTNNEFKTLRFGWILKPMLWQHVGNYILLSSHCMLLIRWVWSEFRLTCFGIIKCCWCINIF